MPNPNNLEALVRSIESTVLSSDDSSTQVIESLLMDNALATTALAYEQQTANMIALANAKWAAGVGWPSVEKLAKAIDERLGLS